MKITVEHVPCNENEIIIRCEHLDEEMLEILSLLKERTMKLGAVIGHEIYMLPPNEIYYSEVVEGKTFLYTKDNVLESHDSLTHLEQNYSSLGFTRIGKSQIVNLHHVKKLKSLMNSRIEVTMNNDEKLIVSRHYTHSLKYKLGLRR